MVFVLSTNRSVDAIVVCHSETQNRPLGNAMEPPPSLVKLGVVSGLFVTCLFVGAPLLLIVAFGLLAAAQCVLVLTDVGSGWQQ